MCLLGGGLIYKHDFLNGDLFEGGLFGGWGLFEDLQYCVYISPLYRFLMLQVNPF